MYKLGPKSIKKKLEQFNLEISLRSISNGIQCKGRKRIYAANGMIVPKRTKKRKVRTWELIVKVAKEVEKKNPNTQNEIAKLYIGFLWIWLP